MKIEITDEMIEAGIEVLGNVDFDYNPYEQILRSGFTAMLEASAQHDRQSQ